MRLRLGLGFRLVEVGGSTLVLVLTTILDGWVGGWVALEEWKLRLTSAKVEVEVEVEAELGNYLRIQLMD